MRTLSIRLSTEFSNKKYRTIRPRRLESPYAAMQQQLVKLIRRKGMVKAQRDVVARLTLTAIEGAVHGASRSGDLHSPLFARELTSLLLSYYQRTSQR